jgi:hypothetical protein
MCMIYAFHGSHDAILLSFSCYPARPMPYFFAQDAQLDLAVEEIDQHLSADDTERVVARDKVQGGEDGVPETEGEHGNDPAWTLGGSFGATGGLTTRILQCPTLGLHHVLLDDTPDQVVAVSGDVGLLGERAGLEGGLLAREDVEVIVGSVSASVAFNADSGTEDQKVPRVQPHAE